jgi:hypothetical protein
MAIEITRYERPGRLESLTRLSKMDIAGALTFDPVSGKSGPSGRTSSAFSKRRESTPPGVLTHPPIDDRAHDQRHQDVLHPGIGVIPM